MNRSKQATATDNLLEKSSTLQAHATERENFTLDAEARSFSLPPADETDKLLRYESHLDRQLDRAIDQLDRLSGNVEGKTRHIL